MLRSRTTLAKLLAGALLVGVLAPGAGPGFAVLPASAASSTPSVFQDAAAERAEVRARKADAAGEVDTMSADQAEIDAALADIKANVKGQESLVTNAQKAWEDADRRAIESERRAVERAAEVTELEALLATAAVNSYVSPPGQDFMDRFRASTATEYAQKQALLGVQASRTGDVIDQLRSAKYALEREQDAAERARADAVRERDEALAQIEQLKAAQVQQEQFASGLRERLNAKLAEVAALESFDQELAAQVRAEQEALVAQVQSLPPAPSPPVDDASPPAPGPEQPVPDPGPGPGTPAPPSPSPSPSPPSVPVPEVPRPGTTWVRGIQVASSIAPQVESLLAAAAADGLLLTGWGFRSADEQIALRRQNCGTTNWAIYYMDPSQCSPPTAIPGSSNHERGLAIDFRNCSTRSTACFTWLAANAGRYGFYNLPSEPWHWSTTGR